MASSTFLRVTFDLMLLAVPYSFRRRLSASLICLSGGTYIVMSSVWLPSLLARELSVFLSLNSSRELFFAVLTVLHWMRIVRLPYVNNNQIKVPTKNIGG